LCVHNQIVPDDNLLAFVAIKSVAFTADGYGFPTKFQLSSKFVIAVPLVPGVEGVVLLPLPIVTVTVPLFGTPLKVVE
jgi:hypothetical protein